MSASVDRGLLEPLDAPDGMPPEEWLQRKATLATALRDRMRAASSVAEPWLREVPDDAVIRAYVLAAGNGVPQLSDEALRRFILDVRDAHEFSSVLSWMMAHVDRGARNDMCLRGTWRGVSAGALA